MNIIRDLNIDIATNNLTGIYGAFISLCNNLYCNKCDIFLQKKDEYLYFNLDYDWIFYYDKTNDILFCNEEKYWKKFDKFNISRQELSAATKFLTSKYLNINPRDCCPCYEGYENITKIKYNKNEEVFNVYC